MRYNESKSVVFPMTGADGKDIYGRNYCCFYKLQIECQIRWPVFLSACQKPFNNLLSRESHPLLLWVSFLSPVKGLAACCSVSTQAAQAHYRNADVTLACERCCVTNGYLQGLVWDVNGFS